MKRIIYVSAAVIVLLLIAGYGYIRWRQHRSYQVYIHQDAALLFKINIDGLLFEMGPGNKNGQKNIPRGLSLPANLFAYTLHSKPALTLFSSLAVTDTAALTKYLSTVLKMNLSDADTTGTHFGSSKDGHLHVAYNSQRIAFAISAYTENLNTTLAVILRGEQPLALNDPKFLKLKNESAHLSYSDGKHTGRGTVKDNIFSFSGLFPTSKLTIPDQAFINGDRLDHPSLSIRLNASLKNSGNGSTLKFRDYVLNKDTLLDCYDGHLSLEIGKTVTQKTELISYEYNDDFEKVAVVKVKENKVPEIILSLGGKAQQLKSYLQKEKVISPDQTVNKALFPLYTLYSKTGAATLQFSTGEGQYVAQNPSASPYFFSATVDFNSIRKNGSFTLLNSYIESLNYLKITAKKQDELSAVFNLSLKFNKD